MNKTKWFALFHGLDYKEYYSKDDAVSKTTFLVVKQLIIGTFNPGGGFDWPISKHIFLDRQGNETIPNEKGWQLVDIEEKYISSSKYVADFIIKDPDRVIKRIEYATKLPRKFEDTSRNNMIAVVAGIKNLFEFSITGTWQEYDLKKENEALKLENEALRQKIKESA